ncbi:MAG: MATE family efflux transporter [Treponema sp.]|jgi:putative MATE family efflux protein|nr:MATE family efflux transporter [Treponema sp.]
MTKNLTVGNPALLILSFAIPLFAGNLFQQFYNMADTFIVGRTIGVKALAAVGSTGSLSFLILGFMMGFTQGAAILTSQRFGAGDTAGIRRSFAATIVISTGVTVVLMAVSIISAGPLLALLRTPADIIDDARLYIIIIYWGIPAALLFNLLSNTMRAIGDSHTPLLFLVAACIINIVLDLVFILVLHTGVEGAAWATVIAQLISGLLCIPVIARKLPALRLSAADLRLSPKELGEHLRLALPVGFQMSIIAIGTVAVSYALNMLGTTAVAAFTAAMKIDQTAVMVLNSFGMAMTTYSAQNYGARKIDRIRQGIIQCAGMSAAYSVFMGLVFLFFGRFFATLFLGKDSGEALSMSHAYLIINGACYLFLSLLFIFRQALQGLGDSLTPTVAGIMELVMRTFAAVILGNIFGFNGICFASPLAWLGALIPLTVAVIFTMKRLNRQAMTWA